MPKFARHERLKSRKAIGSLFKGGNSFVAYPLRVVWKDAEPKVDNALRGGAGVESRGANVASVGGTVESGQTALSRQTASPIMEPASRAQVVVSVPKRNFKTAVTRNRLKRQIREAYRLQKHELYEKLAASDQHISLMVSYIAKEALPYADIAAGVGKMIRKFPGTRL